MVRVLCLADLSGPDAPVLSVNVGEVPLSWAVEIAYDEEVYGVPGVQLLRGGGATLGRIVRVDAAHFQVHVVNVTNAGCVVLVLPGTATDRAGNAASGASIDISSAAHDTHIQPVAVCDGCVVSSANNHTTTFLTNADRVLLSLDFRAEVFGLTRADFALSASSSASEPPVLGPLRPIGIGQYELEVANLTAEANVTVAFRSITATDLAGLHFSPLNITLIRDTMGPVAQLSVDSAFTNARKLVRHKQQQV